MTIRIEIHEQPERKRFWAEVEVGGMIARRRELVEPMVDGDRLAGLRAMARQVEAVVDEMIPKPKPPEPPVADDAAARWEGIGDPVEWPAPRPIEDIARENRESIARQLNEKAALIAEAQANGVFVDRRWGVERLRAAIEEGKARAAGLDVDEPAPASD